MSEPKPWTWLDHVEVDDPGEITIEEWLGLFEGMDGGAKMEYYADKARIGGWPLYDFVKRYLELRGEEPCPKAED